jgi:hypothetical protein
VTLIDRNDAAEAPTNVVEQLFDRWELDAEAYEKIWHL